MCISSKTVLIKNWGESFLQNSESGTYSGAVVHFLPHVVADVLQLPLCDFFHRPHYMQDGLGAVERAATRLKKTNSTNEYVYNHCGCYTSSETYNLTVNVPAHRIPRSSGSCAPGWTCPRAPPLEEGWGVRPPVCGTLCGVGTDAPGFF